MESVQDVGQDLKWWAIDVLIKKFTFHIATYTTMETYVRDAKMAIVFSKTTAYYQ